MKRTTPSSIPFAFAFCLLPCALFAQGSLTPPGAPAPTMKTLNQVEPRTPISSAPFTISAPGSYYLTTNLVGIADNSGIVIAASDVTLDLAGFALIGVERSASGVHVTGMRTNLAIANGAIRAWGEHGVSAQTATGARVFNVSSSHNGGRGISVGDAAIVKDCSARHNADRGISAGVNSVVSGCVAFQNGDGIWANVGSTITGCSARENGGAGISAGTGCTISGCTTHYNGTGIYLNNNCHVLHNNVYDNGQGIEVMLDNNRIDGNNITSCTWVGIVVHGQGNIIVRNTARGNNPNYSFINTTNTVGQILDFSSAGGMITNASAWANFSY